jgi:hypothetical protein
MLRDNRARSQKVPHRMPTDPKPVMAVERVPVFRVHYTTLEAYIQAVFGFEFDYLLAAGVTNGVAVDYLVNGRIEGPAWAKQAEQLCEGRRTKDVKLILNVLASKGYIATGQYTVSTKQPPNPAVLYTSLLRQTGDPNSPACTAFKQTHSNDPVFVSRAAALDSMFTP